MNLFEKAKQQKKRHECQYCKKDFKPDSRNLNRGWGLFCSKSCSSKWRTRMSNAKSSDFKTEMRDYKLRQLGVDL